MASVFGLSEWNYFGAYHSTHFLKTQHVDELDRHFSNQNYVTLMKHNTPAFGKERRLKMFIYAEQKPYLKFRWIQLMTGFAKSGRLSDQLSCRFYQELSDRE